MRDNEFPTKLYVKMSYDEYDRKREVFEGNPELSRALGHAGSQVAEYTLTRVGKTVTFPTPRSEVRWDDWQPRVVSSPSP